LADVVVGSLEEITVELVASIGQPGWGAQDDLDR
jgi:hypothetical protein